VIDTREELIDALTEAAELEHGLLLQYLFAAYSLKKRTDEGLRPHEQELARTWQAVVSDVARQEMAHLGSVCNLLSAIGGAPQFRRPNFPQPHKAYYPFDFHLQRFTDEALYRFICFELPEGEPPPDPPRHARLALVAEVVPDPLDFEYIGQLYGQIRHGFATLPESELFIGPRFAQDTDDWSNRFQLHLVTDRASAELAIDAIVLEGEGAKNRREGSHYDRFLRARCELAAEAGFDPSRPVVLDPRTRPHRDAQAGGTLITHPRTVAVAEVTNSVYLTMLILLLQYYGFGGESPAQRAAIRATLRHLMSGILRPLAEMLTELPATDDAAQGTAGPPFELYADVSLAPQMANRWTVLLERLDVIAARLGELAEDGPSRLALLASNAAWITVNIRNMLRESIF
jgi:hypothetical protein